MRILVLSLLAACASTRGSDTAVVVVPDPRPAAAAPDPAPAPAAAAASTDNSPCDTDADCGFTRVGPEKTACCPMLCTPRVVTRKRAKELDDQIAVCTHGRECPYPQCRPPREQIAPVCVEHKCVGKVVGDDRSKN